MKKQINILTRIYIAILAIVTALILSKIFFTPSIGMIISCVVLSVGYQILDYLYIQYTNNKYKVGDYVKFNYSDIRKELGKIISIDIFKRNDTFRYHSYVIGISTDGTKNVSSIIFIDGHKLDRKLNKLELEEFKIMMDVNTYNL